MNLHIPKKCDPLLGTVICFSHLRWNFVYQRPQHLLSRAAKTVEVFFFEEPIFDSAVPRLSADRAKCGVTTVVPHLPNSGNQRLIEKQQRELLNDFVALGRFSKLTFWYYTPMALSFTDHILPDLCVYDCMDELSAFRFAPSNLLGCERRLFNRCDIVFTGGRSLYEAKRCSHHNVHLFPSSIDKEHFTRARMRSFNSEPFDLVSVGHPRVGFFGVIDERMNLDLLGEMASIAPDLEFVMVGPVVKISSESLPKAANLHWLGGKNYDELPAYLAHWECGIMPFALNESTRFISPTKTPEYLAAGLPLVSTRVRDVADPYLHLDLVQIADDAHGLVAAVRRAIEDKENPKRLARVDRFLSDKSWDSTFSKMKECLEEVVRDNSNDVDDPVKRKAGRRFYQEEREAIPQLLGLEND